MFNFKLLCLVIFLFQLQQIKSQISDKRYCANENCTKQISLAKSIIAYSGLHHHILSFPQNANVIVYSKSAGSNMDLWGVEINGKRGYVPKTFLRETKVFTNTFPYLIDTELNEEQVPSKETENVIKETETITPDKASNYDVVDGTTIYHSPDELIMPTTTEKNVQPTITIDNNQRNDEIEVEEGADNKEVEPLQASESVLNDNSNEKEIVEENNNERQIVEGNNNEKEIVEENNNEKEIIEENNNEKEIIEENNNEEKETKESLVDNLYQSIQNWITEPAKQEEKQIAAEDSRSMYDEPVDDEEEEVDNEEDDEDDDEDKAETSVETEDEDIVENEQINNEVPNSEDSVKSRKLLSEESTSKDAQETLSKEEGGITEPGSEIKSKESDPSDCSGENCLQKEEIEEHKSDVINEADIVTESAYKEIPAFEVPLPLDEYVTPNPMQIDQTPPSTVDSNEEDKTNENNNEDTSESTTEEILENKESLENTQVNNEDKSSEITTDINENTEVNNEDKGSEISTDTNENTEITQKNENTPLNQVDENLSTTNEEKVHVEISKEAENFEIHLESKDNGSDNIKPENTNLSNGNQDLNNQNTEDLENKSIDIEINPKEETNTSTNTHNDSQIQDTPLETNGEKSNITENTETPTSENLVTIENPAGILTGIYSNWYQPNSEKIEETIAPEQENVNLNQEIETNLKELGDIKIQEHDHSFMSMINEGNDVPTEKSESSKVQEESAVSDVPINNLEQNEIEAEDDIKETPGITEQVLDHTEDQLLSKGGVDYGSCSADGDCPTIDISATEMQLEMEENLAESLELSQSDYFNLFTVLAVTGFSVVVFMLGYISIDKSRREGPLIAKINTLEKALLVSSKETELLTDKITEIQNDVAYETDRVSNQELDDMKLAYQELLSVKTALEEQIQSLEKELENSTEVGLELNRMLQDILSSQNGSETLIANVEQLQRQLVEQQGTITSINDTVNLKDTENHEVLLELEIKNKKVTHLQAELDKMALNLFKVEEDKEQMQAKLEIEIIELKDQFEKTKNNFNSTRTKLLDEITTLKSKYSEAQRNLELKTNEYTILKDNFNQIKAIKNNTEALESLLNASSMKAELQQLQRDNQALNDLLRQEQQTKFTFEKQIEIALQEAQSYKVKYDESDKEKLEALTKLEVLSNYFKEKETQLQKELNKHESLWLEQQGEATSTVERIKYMQEELHNYKLQNESLKQEIVSQEVDLKSQISLLEKKAHENWVTARQAERRLEDAKQEAAQLRNRLTLKERSFVDDKGQNRIQSPLEQNGDVGISPLHMPVESPASPPLLYGARDHLTTSPPMPNMPPFLPPPPGVPFMPPPIPGAPGFMPPPPSMFPVDHRPPPLGRMSSPPPPLNSRYTPDSRYSPYDRNSPSPLYDDDYGPSPPLRRGYSPYNSRDDRRDYKRPPPPPGRTNGRNKGAMSSGSGNSNESLEQINRHHSKV